MALSLARAYRSLGHSVTVYTAELDRNCFPDLIQGLDVRVVPFPAKLDAAQSGGGLFSMAYRRIKKALLFGRVVRAIAAALPDDIDVLHCQNDESYRLGVLYKKRNPRAKVVWIMHNPPFYHSRKNNPFVNAASAAWAAWERRTVARYAKGIDRVITYDREKEQAAVALGLPVKRMAIPVDLEKFSAPVKRLQGAQGPTVLFCAGGLSPTRRFEDVVAAAAVLRAEGYDVRARIVCHDYWRDDGYRRQFADFIRRSGAGDAVEVRYDGAPEAEFLELLKASSIFIFPSDIKIWGMTVFEAMAAGLPVVISRTTSVVEFLEDGTTALFVEPHDPRGIAAQVKKLLDDDAFAKGLARRGQEFVKANLNWSRYAAEAVRFP